MLSTPAFVRSLLAVALALSLASCSTADDDAEVQPSGRPVVRTFAVVGIDEVSVSNAFDATITQAPETSAEITIDDNLVDYLVVEARNDRLYVDLDGVRSIRGTASLEARITLPTLNRLDLSGASHGHLVGFTGGDDLEVVASGASSVEGELSAGQLRLELSGASSADLVGTAENAYLGASGASVLELGDLVIADAEINLSGASRADVHVTDQISRATASGASTLRYNGDPTLGAVDSSGASTIEAR